MSRRLHRLVLALVATAFVGCNSAPVPDVDADSFVFYSIKSPGNAPQHLEALEKLHGYEVLGKIDIKDMKTREAVVAAFREGAPGGDGPFASCFFPRHAISTIVAGKRIDYVICFECGQYRIIQGDKWVVKSVSGAPSSTFNSILTQAGVTLAPPPGAVSEP
ncbi:MAG: hypothetical protein V4719_14280 [Planctomycetota bacterium]